MNAQTQKHVVNGAAGPIEVAVDAPSGPAAGYALICHPHPLFGGTMDNKVVQTLARAALQVQLQTVRFNFRGVGGSAGLHDNGLGETDDVLAVANAELPERARLVLMGFSFGSFVASRALAALAARYELTALVYVGPATSRFEMQAVPSALHERALVVHGEADDTVPLAATLDWARPQTLPVTVVPEVGHFFHGQLPLLKNLVARHLKACV